MPEESSAKYESQRTVEVVTSSEQVGLSPDRRLETYLSMQSAEVLKRRIAEIWSQAAQQITPLIERLRLDDAQDQRQVDHRVGVVLQVHTFKRDVGETRERLRIVRDENT